VADELTVDNYTQHFTNQKMLNFFQNNEKFRDHFIALANRAHELGLDWYETGSGGQYPVRLGRKDNDGGNGAYLAGLQFGDKVANIEYRAGNGPGNMNKAAFSPDFDIDSVFNNEFAKTFINKKLRERSGFWPDHYGRSDQFPPLLDKIPKAF